MKPVPEMSEDAQAAVSADSLLTAEAVVPTNRKMVRLTPIIVELWWFRLKHRIQMRLRRALGIDTDLTIIGSHLSHHERLIDAQRSDFESHEESARQLRKLDRQYMEATELRLNHYEHNNDQLKHTARQLRDRRRELFNIE